MDDLFQDNNVWDPGVSAFSDKVPVLLPPMESPADSGSVKAAHGVCHSVAE
jgi:hypothetical protein